MSKLMSTTAVVVRCWNNPHIEKVVKRYLDMGMGLVVVVVNSTPDKGATRAWLADVHDSRLVVLDIFEGFNWSPALNRALMSIQMANLSGKHIRFVLNASVETLFTSADVHAMLCEFADDTVGVVGTTFDLRLNGNSVSGGRSYRHPRNTGMIIRLSVFGVTHGAFDAYCDDVGGMEDIDFILSMLALSKFRPIMLDLGVRLIVGVNYNQAQKELREQEAMNKIIARWRALFCNGTLERKRIDKVIVDMSIDNS